MNIIQQCIMLIYLIVLLICSIICSLNLVVALTFKKENNESVVIIFLNIHKSYASSPQSFASNFIIPLSEKKFHTENQENLKYNIYSNYHIISNKIPSETKWYTKQYYYNRSDW